MFNSVSAQGKKTDKYCASPVLHQTTYSVDLELGWEHCLVLYLEAKEVCNISGVETKNENECQGTLKLDPSGVETCVQPDHNLASAGFLTGNAPVVLRFFCFIVAKKHISF